jgi:hypothetical protein
MASLEEFKTFAKRYKMKGAGIYVIQSKSVDPMPIKVGFSTNLLDRFRKYDATLPWGYTVLGVARVTNAKAAEDLMKETLAQNVQYKKEWIDPKYKNKILNAWAGAHQKYARNGPLGQYVFTSDDIKSMRLPTEYKPLPERRVTRKTEQVVIPLQTSRPLESTQKPIMPFHYVDGVRRSARLLAKSSTP